MDRDGLSSRDPVFRGCVSSPTRLLVIAALAAGVWLPSASWAQVLPAEREAFEKLGRQVDGLVVWSSNRDGNHELYLVDLATGEERRLTNHPRPDFFSRFSPDGRRIAFLRGQRRRVSFREHDAWDLWVMDADGGRQRRLVERAYHPTWTPDGTGIVYVQDNAVMRHDLASREDEVIHRGEEAPTAGEVEEPEMLTDDLVAITLRGVPHETVGVIDLAAGRYIPISAGRACQITWVAGRREVVWIDDGGRGDKQVMRASLDDPRPEVLIDLPHEFSHEYFPRVTRDGQWLIWGAAAEGHEHDQADYEIFAWRLGAPWESAARLTHSSSNDQWPDLYVR